MSKAHKLQNSWELWEHKDVPKGGDWRDAMTNVCEFSTVEEFWKCWSFIPRPGDVFTGSKSRDLEGRCINGFSLFKKGIRPEWEDAANATGSEYQCRKTMSLPEIDLHWENLVLALIGEMIDERDEICGCRVVDKSKKGNNRQIFRLELWLRTKDLEVGERIKARMLDMLADGDRKGGAKLPFERCEH